MSGLAGTAVGDLFVFGDIRDALREGARLATGREADELILGLACVGLAVTAGTYATVGAAAPVRAGITVVKAARKTGRIGGALAAWITRSRARRRRLDGASRRPLGREHDRACGRGARRARGGQGRKGARAGAAASATSGACRRRPARRRRSTD